MAWCIEHQKEDGLLIVGELDSDGLTVGSTVESAQQLWQYSQMDSQLNTTAAARQLG